MNLKKVFMKAKNYKPITSPKFNFLESENFIRLFFFYLKICDCFLLQISQK